MEATPEDHIVTVSTDNPNAFRSMRDRMHPPRMSAPSCIVPPIEQLVIRPHIVPLLPTFHGMESENPYAHIKEFEDDNGLKRQISNFSAKENEKFYECWERYMEAINACPHHGFDTWLLFQEDGMNRTRRSGKMKSQPNALNAKAGMYTLNEDIDMKAKVAAMTRRLEELELKKIHEVQAVSETPVQVMPIPFVNLMSTWWRSVLQFQLEKCLEIKQIALQYTQPGQASQQASNLEQAIVNLSKAHNLNTVQEKGRFPSQPHQNPKGIHEVELMRENLHRHDKQVPTYAKFLKGLVHIKRGLNVNKKAFLTEQYDWRNLVEKALLDLGASVNLLPYSVYKQLGLGELKPTSITLSLADRSVKIPRGMIEDVLVQVAISTIQWILLFLIRPNVKETNYVPIILGKPFLATSNAIINCRNGLMQLTFGNMTLKLNIFYMCKKPINPEEEESPERFACYSTTLEEDKEILPLFKEKKAQEAVKEEEAPKLSVKPLPMELKYAYLEENKKCTVVISSSLTTP
ncbi:hypothetical protein CK203_088927 [Vitis vinifera]|uniref:Retrotransposon gag domain-containing protein n=1 Tax=Vitis vinifera TaxID=29760 RepID=A0A438D0U2_VITVI|nr:hypothetical protein CK203_088927 [Vitis vinifera]